MCISKSCWPDRQTDRGRTEVPVEHFTKRKRSRCQNRLTRITTMLHTNRLTSLSPALCHIGAFHHNTVSRKGVCLWPETTLINLNKMEMNYENGVSSLCQTLFRVHVLLEGVQHKAGGRCTSDHLVQSGRRGALNPDFSLSLSCTLHNIRGFPDRQTYGLQ